MREIRDILEQVRLLCEEKSTMCADSLRKIAAEGSESQIKKRIKQMVSKMEKKGPDGSHEGMKCFGELAKALDGDEAAMRKALKAAAGKLPSGHNDGRCAPG